MKRKMRRLFAFLLALVILAPMGVPVGAAEPKADTANLIDQMAHAEIVSSAPDSNGVYTMDFSVKQDISDVFTVNKIGQRYIRNLDRVTFTFSYDPTIVIPVDSTTGDKLDIQEGSQETSSFTSENGSLYVDWMKTDRVIVRVTWQASQPTGVSCEELQKLFSFSYKLADNATNGAQGIFQIERDPETMRPLFEKFFSRAGIKLAYNEQKMIGGIIYRYVNPKDTSALVVWSTSHLISDTGDGIILSKFEYPGCDGTTRNDIEDINLWSHQTQTYFPSSSNEILKTSFIVTATNADGVRIPFCEDDTVEWYFACTDPAVEKARLADQNRSIDLVGTAKETRDFTIKYGAEAYHRCSAITTSFNIYNVSVVADCGKGTKTKTRKLGIYKSDYDALTLVQCTVTGRDMPPYTYSFPAEIDGGPTTLVSQDLCIIPRPKRGLSAEYTFTYKFRNSVLDEDMMPQKDGHLSTSIQPSNNGNMSFYRGSVTQNKGHIGTLQFTSASTSAGQARTGYYEINLSAIKREYYTEQQKYSWKMSFFLTDILYTWPEALTNDPLTPLTMKPDQTYQDLLDELKQQNNGQFFNQYAATCDEPDAQLSGEVSVKTPDYKPTGQNEYVTFKFTVNDEGTYKGHYVEYRKPVKVATLPTEPISATITKVDSNDYNNQLIQINITKSQLKSATSLQSIPNFPSSVTLSWTGGSAEVTGSDLKFDATLDELKALSVGETKDMHFQSPASNINLANGLTVKVKVVPTGLGGGAGTVTLPGGGSYPYTGSPITPLPSVTVGGVTLAKDRDYTVEYKDNVNAGTGKIIVTGKGDYSGTIETDFTISKAPLPGVIVDGAVITAGKTEYIAKVGDVLTPKFENGLAPNAADWVWKEKDTDTQVSNKRVYVPKAADAGKKIYVEAKAKPDTNYSQTPVSTSLPVQIVLPISGSVYIRTAPSSGGGGTSAPIGSGTKLTAVITPDYPETVKWDYQWKKDGQVIPGEEGPTYILPGGITDNSKITVDVKPKDDSPVTGSLKSEDEITVGKKPLEVEKVEVSVTPSGGGGGPKPGDKLVASVTPTGGGGGTPENPPYKFVWMKDGEPVPDEEGPEYILKPEDKGKEITVAVVPKEDDGEYTGTVPTETAPIQVPSTKPGAPENVTVVTGPGNHEITVKWDSPADDGGKPIEEYKVVVTDGEDKPVAEVPVDHDKTQCVIPGLKDDEEYKVKVIAVNGDGESDPVVPSGPDDPDDPDDPDKPDKPDGPDDPDDPKPTPKPGSGGGWIFFPTNPTPKPSPSASPSESPSPVPTTSPDPSGPPKPTPDISPSPLPSSDPWPSACPRDDTCPIAPFPDANPKEWYHDGLHFCTGKNLMNGYANGLLGPNDRMTRAQLAMILYNMEKRPDNSGVSGFPDVPSNAWCAKAVTWAVTNRVMRGYSNGLFGPDDPVTREQLVAALYRYADSPPAQGSLERFTDWEEVSPYAKEGMIWAVSKDLVRGMGNNRLSPKSTSTRAQVGTIIYRYCKLISYRDA